MKIEVLNILAPDRMTPCPPTLQLQTFWIGEKYILGKKVQNAT